MRELQELTADIDEVLSTMEKKFYRVSVFGSARIDEHSPMFKEVYELAYQLSKMGADIVTGGGPGLMQAANKGAKDSQASVRSIGLSVDLPFENSNNHLDVKRQHRRFSSRLEEFMRISHAVVVTAGGVGTMLELFYTWQLIQVSHIKPRPIILLGCQGMWDEFIQWLRKWPLKLNLVSDCDLTYLKHCCHVEDVLKLLKPQIEEFYQKREQAKAEKSKD